MNNTDHCLVCENKKMESRTGVYCGITGEKPKFLNKCPDKKFSISLENKIVEIHNKLELVKNTKSATNLHLYTYLGISISILITCYLLTIFLWEKGWMSTLTLTIGAIGLGMIPIAIAPLNKYKRLLKLASNDVIKIKEILSSYNISYEIETILIKQPHDSIDIESKLTINENNKSTTKQFQKMNAGNTIGF